MAKRGHEVLVLAPKYQRSTLCEKLNGYSVIRCFNPPSMKLKLDLCKIIRHLKTLKTLTSSFDVIHATSDYVPYSFACSLIKFKKPLVITLHGTYSIAESNFERFLLRRTFKAATLLVAVSNYTRHEVIRNMGVTSRKVVVVPNGVDVNTFNPSIDGLLTRRMLGLNLRPLVLTVARLVPRKGLDFSLKAFQLVLKEIRDAAYVIVGDGPMLSSLKRLAKELKISNSVFFVGKVDKRLLPHYYAAADVFLLTPKRIGRAFEGFGLVILEAAACGKPSVGLFSGGLSDAIANGTTGFLIRRENVEEVATAVIKLLSDKQLRSAMGYEAFKRVINGFTWDLVAKRMEEHYWNALKSL